MKIVLLGYMASGKSAVGRKLAEKLDLQFVDLDDFIEENEEMSISDMFSKKGEIYFRKKESEYLEILLNNKKNLLISSGGGTPCYGNNLNSIKEKSISIYLDASIQTIFDRLKNETSQRPLVATIGIDSLKEYIAKHLFERRNFYEKATHKISVNNKSIAEISTEVLELF
ncbi:shikimate kinase [Lutibacter oricola]|uniref:Shikimate kinase n=1 Tax=Lutibacter oricola TaxID=762486 RepID=A0A1H2XM39_9FLAO|nr:shikimate kinase [Lutibacter oricola]SDW93952.1 shikimate kinase [Lutibacter oricola]